MSIKTGISHHTTYWSTPVRDTAYLSTLACLIIQHTDHHVCTQYNIQHTASHNILIDTCKKYSILINTCISHHTTYWSPLVRNTTILINTWIFHHKYDIPVLISTLINTCVSHHTTCSSPLIRNTAYLSTLIYLIIQRTDHYVYAIHHTDQRLCISSYNIQPVAFGVSSHPNLQSPISLVSFQRKVAKEI